MSTNHGDEPAFPGHPWLIPLEGGGFLNLRDYGAEGHPGMTYRQWLEGKALQGLLANTRAWEGCNFADMAHKAIGAAQELLFIQAQWDEKEKSDA